MSWGLAGKIWQKSRITFFFVLLVGSIVSGGLIWQRSLYGAGWSAERKKEFMDSQNKNVEFKQQAYLKVMEQIDEKKERNNEEYKDIKNIFTSY